ncbi:Fc.00g039720.m01.CDS01 [Cosmosporella sp. VM-42]
MPSYNGITPTSTPPSNGAIPMMSDMSSYGAMAMAPADTPFGPMMFPVFQPQMPPPMLNPEASKTTPNGHAILLTNGISAEQVDKSAPKMGSCCGGGRRTSTPPTQPSTAASSPNGNSNGTSEPRTKSCCSPDIKSPKTEVKTDILPPNDIPTPNSVMMSPFQTPVMMPNGMYGYYPQPTVFTYPPQYGSYMQPLQPEQWKQVMSSMGFGQGTMPSPYGMPGAIPYHPPSAPQSAAGTSHQCSCGDSCQCVGCAAHPYNDATRSYVRSAWETMLDDNQTSGHTNGNHSHNINGNGGQEISITNGLSNGNTFAHADSTEGTKSPTAPQTPSDAASGLSEEQALSANDFFFITKAVAGGIVRQRQCEEGIGKLNHSWTSQMDHRDRSPHRDRYGRDREVNERGNHEGSSRRQDSRSRSPAHKRSRTSRHDHASEPRTHHSSKHRSRRHRDEASRKKDEPLPRELPYSARPLGKADLTTFEPLLAEYLSLQKQKDIDDMDDRETRGRWKSFLGKWNRGELAEGWYDPDTFTRIVASHPGRKIRVKEDERKDEFGRDAKEEEEDEEDDYGPVLPSATRDAARRTGPGIPSLQDLSLRSELQEEDKQASIAALRDARKADRAVQKERLDDIVPRADAGSHERKQENRQLLNEKLRSFREKSPGVEEAPDKELMGGGDSLEELKAMKQREQRRKTEREVRREEVERAKQEEMEERRRAWREREEGTVGMLRELARQRFG